MSHNFLYGPFSLFQFRSLFINTTAPYISPQASIVHFMPYNFLYDPLRLFQFRPDFINELLLDIALTQT